MADIPMFVQLTSLLEWVYYHAVSTDKQKEVNMLTLLLVIGIVLLILWLLGFSIGFLAGPILWIILVVAIILVIIWLVRRLVH